MLLVLWVCRLSFGGSDEEKTPPKEIYDEIVQKIEQKKFPELFVTDQLVSEMKQGNVFLGFQEGIYGVPCSHVYLHISYSLTYIHITHIIFPTFFQCVPTSLHVDVSKDATTFLPHSRFFVRKSLLTL